MIPDPWTFIVLALAAYRLTRLAGWDEFPLALKIRAWIIGEYWVWPDAVVLPTDQTADAVQDIERRIASGVEKAEGTGRVDAAELGLPGKQPTSPVAEVRPAYRRPVLAHLFHCPFCIGFWISLTTYLLWLAWSPVLYGLVPFAISGTVGVIAKNLDA